MDLKRYSTDIKAFVALLLYAFVILFFISPDSWTHDLYGRCDSAWFFMCGKAWMNGMVPYVDFTDSKGPLLWLIYGIGYLISHNDYTGVLLLSTVWYGAIFYVIYKTCRLYVPSARVSFFATLLMAIPLFNPVIRYETRAEDFALLFIALSNYHATKVVMSDMCLVTLRRASWVVGMSTGALFLIKYNLSVWNGIFWLWLMWRSVKQGCGWFAVLLRLLAGTIAVLLPFVAYMAAVGCLDDCVVEYIVSPSLTMSEARGSLLANKLLIAVMLAYLVVVPLFTMLFQMPKRMKVFNLTVFSVFYLTVFLSNANGYNLAVFSLFALPAALWLAEKLRKPLCRSRVVTAVAFVAVLLVCLSFNLYLNGRMTKVQRFPTLFWPVSHAQANFYWVSSELGSVPSPRVCYLECWPQPEYGVAVGSLPGCRRWAWQNGSTVQMVREQWEECKKSKPDFIFVLPQVVGIPEKIDTLQRLGYEARTLPFPDESGHNINYVMLSKERVAPRKR